MGRSRGRVLWAPFFESGEMVGLSHAEYPDEFCLPLFDSPILVALWILNQGGGSQMMPSNPLYPNILLRFLEDAEDRGFYWIMLNPPYDPSAPRQMFPIEDLIDQVEEVIYG